MTNGILAFLGFSAVNPLLLWGGLLIASPIIIHLLSKRKFKVIEWAAIDFLLEANRRNQRRIQLENLLLLLLRCLAILLLALLVARPLIQSNVMGRAIAAYRVERIIVLDDSPSMSARGARKTCFEDAREGLIGFMRNLAQERPGDSLTLLTTSDPERPLVNGQFASAEKAEEWAALLGKAEVSDLPARLDKALLAVEQTLSARSGNVNRIVYVVSDLRQRDWLTGEGKGQDSALTAVIKRLRPRLENLIAVDVGGRRNANLAITGLTTLDKSPVVGVPTRFEVSVRNFGDLDVNDVEVTFTAADAVPQRATSPSVKAGSSVSVPFTFTFRDAGSASVTAEIGADDLSADNTRYYAASVQDGVNVLVVDGEPSSEYGQAETFFIDKALAPPGDLRSGNVLQIVTENQFESTSLDSFQTVMLCNVYRLSEERIAALEAFVQAGGGLIIFLGDQVDEAAYNGRLHRGGQGLFPVRLNGIEGDESERQWANLSPRAMNHPVLRVYQGANNPFVSMVKIFRWWSCSLPEDGSGATVLATLNTAKAEPLVVEKSFGKGKVMAIMTAGDGEWSTWPADPSFVVCVLEMVAHTARSTAGDSQFALCSPLRHLLNVGRYESQVTVVPPAKEKSTQLRGAPSEDGRGLLVEYDDTRQRGFYRINATRRDGKSEQFLYAANIDPEEGDLRSAAPAEIRRRLGDTPVDFVSGMEQFQPSGAVSHGEIWRTLLVMMGLVLCTEQLLGWFFGRKR